MTQKKTQLKKTTSKKVKLATKPKPKPDINATISKIKNIAQSMCCHDVDVRITCEINNDALYIVNIIDTVNGKPLILEVTDKNISNALVKAATQFEKELESKRVFVIADDGGVYRSTDYESAEFDYGTDGNAILFPDELNRLYDNLTKIFQKQD